MKIIGFASDNSVIAEVSVKEMIQFSGFCHGNDFNEMIGFAGTMYSESLRDHDKRFIGLQIPVSEIYADAKETLAAYSDLKTKLESVRNQITTLTNKMNQLNQKEDDE